MRQPGQLSRRRPQAAQRRGVGADDAWPLRLLRRWRRPDAAKSAAHAGLGGPGQGRHRVADGRRCATSTACMDGLRDSCLLATRRASCGRQMRWASCARIESTRAMASDLARGRDGRGRSVGLVVQAVEADCAGVSGPAALGIPRPADVLQRRGRPRPGRASEVKAQVVGRRRPSATMPWKPGLFQPRGRAGEAADGARRWLARPVRGVTRRERPRLASTVGDIASTSPPL